LALGAGVAAWCLAHGGASAQERGAFTLGFAGPDRLVSPGPDVARVSYYPTIGHEGSGPGTQGWSISVAIESDPPGRVRIAGLTKDGTDANDRFRNGFFVAQQVNPASGRNDGRNGFVSAMVLSFVEPLTLPTNTVSTVLRVDLEVVTAPGGKTFTLRYVDGLQGNGQPVQNALTVAGATLLPPLTERTIPMAPAVDCCDAAVLFGFSTRPLSSAEPFAGGIAADSGCLSIRELRASADGSLLVYPTLVSRLEGTGVQGWSLALALEGAAGIVEAAVPAPRALGLAGAGALAFEQTGAIDPSANGGQRGVTSAVVLAFDPTITLPPRATTSVLEVTLSASAAPGAGDPPRATLRLRDGLVGSGQAVRNLVAAGGDSAPPCNAALARLDIVYVGSIAFQRGDVNADGRVNLADAVHTLNELFLGGPGTLCADAADANNDGALAIADPVFLLEHLFRSGPPLPPPFGACGPDSRADALGCVFAACP
jgi:hypothetical protein